MESSYLKSQCDKKGRKTKINVRKSNELIGSRPKDSQKSTININLKCRICLGDGNVPIYGNEDSPDMSKDIKTFGDIKLSEEDNFPKYICHKCYLLLENCIKFRKMAKESQEVLLKASITTIQLHDSEENDIKIEKFEANTSITTIQLHDSEENDIKIEKFEANNDNSFETHELADKSQTYECTVCKAHFETSKDYSTHKKSHRRNKKIRCEICLKLINSDKYKKHLLIHGPSNLICEICGKTFRKDNLIRHLEMHDNKLPYQCPKCPYRGRLRYSLKVHMRSHTGNKPYSCDICQEKFGTRGNLNRHKLRHSKEKSFKCEECGRSFYTESNLNAHLKSDHTGILFQCTSCGTMFGTRKSLLRHELQVHKRDKMPRGTPLYLKED